MSKTKEPLPPSPLDELRIPADRVWEKIAGKAMPDDAELQAIVDYERAARAAWIKSDADKKVKREEKKAEREDEE